MSRHHHDDCCYPAMMGYGGYGMGGYYGGAGYGAGGGALGIRWIYALLILIVIVLQFGRKNECVPKLKTADGCCDDGTVVDGTCGGFLGSSRDGVIDNSVLFIIVVFLLILCAGCWWGHGTGGYGGCY